MTMKKKRKCCDDRRGFLLDSWQWIKVIAGVVLVVPVLRFLNFDIPRKTRKIMVHRVLKVGGFILERDFIIFDRVGGPQAVSRKCTHLGCRLNYNEQEKVLLCPCHQSRFSPAGKRLAGPAKLDLETYPVETLGEGDNPGFVVTI
ncbi:MAG: Rieske 2Fe-2S domain-containing protein [Proteobacteria bacterium]|nr:Rieske 2Fe-2S domain-containing protein [Pseudomonadota bacterium]MBU1715189.1 Rieske 2Fe-2S domain-containing protein [Pseudomonadota bacterium]